MSQKKITMEMPVAEKQSDRFKDAFRSATPRATMTVVSAEAWRARLTQKSDGSLRPSIGNVILILENDPAWLGCLRLNQFSNQIEKTREPPFPKGQTGPLMDADGIEIAAWIGQQYFLDIKTSVAHEAILVVATRNPFHPVREYLDSLTWDGVARIPNFFERYFEAEHNDYTRSVAISFFISAAARIYDPGCKVDTMVILEGNQGLGKTRSVRALAGESWYTEATESPTNKDFYQALRGKWLVEIGEMQAFSKSESNKIKQVITIQSDNYRPSYGRYSRDFPRQSIFLGTTNEENYLNDATGARRFLPIRCHAADTDGILTDRDQLWAEAVARYQRREPWWQIPEAAKDEQDARYNADSWEGVISDWLEGKAKDTSYPASMVGRIDRVTVTEVLQYAVGMETGKHDRAAQTRAGNALRRLGWRPVQMRDASVRKRYYQRPMAPPSCHNLLI